MQFYRNVRRFLRPFKRMYSRLKIKIIELPYRFRSAENGSAAWLIQREVVYGGLQSNVPREKVSPRDTRELEQLSFGGMIGGDRMLHHGYASTYADSFRKFIGVQDLTVAEFGILKGTGLAVWCDLFPKSRVMGFDIDLGHFEKNRPDLERLGAFKKNTPDLYEYDQLVDGSSALAAALNGGRFDIVIDDGLHSIEAILQTWLSVKLHLSSSFVYIIEDFPELLTMCGDSFAEYDCRSFGEITVIQSVR